MAKLKPKHYYDECWQQSFWFMESWTVERAKRFLKTVNMDHAQHWAQGKTLYATDGTGPIIIWTKARQKPADRAAMLAHECIHAAHICLDRAGVKADFDNDEAVTYLVTVLMRQALSK